MEKLIMKKRFRVIETYCGGYLTKTLFFSSKKAAIRHLEQYKKRDELNLNITIVEQQKLWYKKYWKTIQTIAAWKN